MMNFTEAKQRMFTKLGDYKIMALASCVDNYPMVRSVSCIFYNDKIYFKTDKNFRKTQQLYQNPRVAMCWHNVQVEGEAKITGLVIEEPGRIFEKKYKELLWGSYNAYSHEEEEILVEVSPKFVEIWDTDEDNFAFQMFIDFDQESVEIKGYDEKN